MNLQVEARNTFLRLQIDLCFCFFSIFVRLNLCLQVIEPSVDLVAPGMLHKGEPRVLQAMRILWFLSK